LVEKERLEPSTPALAPLNTTKQYRVPQAFIHIDRGLRVPRGSFAYRPHAALPVTRNATLRGGFKRQPKTLVDEGSAYPLTVLLAHAFPTGNLVPPLLHHRLHLGKDPSRLVS
jgi:hypothetical protein